MLTFERQYWNNGVSRLAGIDEAGRGTLAGPVVAAAVTLDRAFAETEEHRLFEHLTDSKMLSQCQREAFFEVLIASAGVAVGIGFADTREIERLNILRATYAAMVRALNNLPAPPDHALVDGLPVDGLPVSSTAIIGGDAKSLCIAAASVVAKVVRDDYMRKLDSDYPQYGFGRHKGYGTALHIQALLEYGPCPAHRKTFRPVLESENIRTRAMIRGRSRDGLSGGHETKC